MYWGCTARDSNAGASFITTAVLAVTGSLSGKQYLFNPWSSQPCSAEATHSMPPISQPHEARGVDISAHVRRHPLLAPSGITQKSGLFGATVTSGDFTLWVLLWSLTHELKLIVPALLLQSMSTFMKCP